jgi:hypothetical protein
MDNKNYFVSKNPIHNALRLKEIEGVIDELLLKEFYRFNRHNIVSTMAFVESNEPLDFLKIKQNIRILDEISEINKNFYFIIFSYTTIDKAYKASQNLISKFHNVIIHIVLEEFKKSDKKHTDIIRRINSIMNETKKSNESLICDESIHEMHQCSFHK